MPIAVTHHAYQRAWKRFRITRDRLDAELARPGFVQAANAQALVGIDELHIKAGKFVYVCRVKENGDLVVVTVARAGLAPGRTQAAPRGRS